MGRVERRARLRAGAGGVAVLSVLLAAPAVAGPPRTADYKLELKQDRVTLKAERVPLIRLLRDLGERYGFELVADIPEDVRVSARFARLPVDEALRRLCVDVGYIEVRDPETDRIRRLVLTPREVNPVRLADKPQNDPDYVPPPEVPIPGEPEIVLDTTVGDGQAQAAGSEKASSNAWKERRRRIERRRRQQPVDGDEDGD